jgi:hypothetical protein
MADETKVEKKDEFLSRFVFEQKGKPVTKIMSDNYTVSAPEGVAIGKGERPAILAELKKRFPKAVFTWVG